MGLYEELGIQDNLSDAELATYLSAVRGEWSQKLGSTNPMERQRAELKLRQIGALENAEARLGSFPKPALVMKTLCAAIDHKYSDYYGLEESLVRSCSMGSFRGEFRSALTYLSKIGEEDLVQEWKESLRALGYEFSEPRERLKSKRITEETAKRQEKSPGKPQRTENAGPGKTGKPNTAGRTGKKSGKPQSRLLRSIRKGKIPVSLIAMLAAVIAAVILLVVVLSNVMAARKAQAEAKAQEEAAAAAAQAEEEAARKAQEELLAGLQGMENYSISTEVDTVSALPSVMPVSCEASSVLVGSSGKEYGTSYLFDQNPETNWQEGEEGDGIGVTITSTFSSKTMVKAITFCNGNEISEDRFRANNRLQEVTITVSCEGESYAKQVRLEDYLGEQNVIFEEAVPAETIVIQIDSVYNGTVYQDTVLTGLDFHSAQ